VTDHEEVGRAQGAVEVRGHSGRVNSQDDGTPGGALRTILWEETSGAFVVVGGSVDEEALLAAAERLRPATEQEWAGLEALGNEVSPDE
jgi:hypothetical protein